MVDFTPFFSLTLAKANNFNIIAPMTINKESYSGSMISNTLKWKTDKSAESDGDIWIFEGKKKRLTKGIV